MHVDDASRKGFEQWRPEHTHEPGEPIKRCNECHKKKETKIEGFSVVAPKNSKAYHKKCKGCHKYTLEELEKPAGPTKCKLCHIK